MKAVAYASIGTQQREEGCVVSTIAQRWNQLARFVFELCASACISSSSKPRASVKMSSGLPVIAYS
jgi:hypothetical protein